MDEDLNFFDDTMAGYDFNPYPSSEVHPRWNNNRYYLRAPESAIYEDGMPGVISPHMEADVSNMQIGESLIEHPGTDNILSDPSHLQAPEHPANTGHSSPWNALYSESGYGNITSEEMFPTARDHNRFLNVPGNPRSRGTGGTARSSISITGTSNTTSLGGRSEWIQEPTGTRRPRGGREQGSRLSAPIVQNGRQVRQVGGACFRCTALRERCSDGTPCKACRKLKGRKWDGCIRSFHELTDLLDPDILASRLRSQVLTGWIYGNAPIPPCRREFDLPLSFGFGKPFIGFRGVEYDPRTEHALWSYTVGQSETHPQSVQFSRSLPVCPVNSSSIDVQKKVWRWLKQTLWSNESMEDWLYTCFPGSRAEWIRELLRVVWGYSIDCWNEGRRNEGRLQEVDKNLFEAWMACLIVTILSLPITVPESEIDKIVRHLEFARDYSGPYSNTSRALAKCVKSLLFDMYQQFVQGVTQALDRYDQLRTDDITDRYLCHMELYCHFDYGDNMSNPDVFDGQLPDFPQIERAGNLGGNP